MNFRYQEELLTRRKREAEAPDITSNITIEDVASACNIDLNTFQRRALEFIDNNDRVMITAGRQCGKSTMVTLLAVQHLLDTATSNSNMTIVTPSNAMSVNLACTILQRINDQPEEYHNSVMSDRLNITNGDNGNNILLTSGVSINLLGNTRADHLIIDETRSGSLALLLEYHSEKATIIHTPHTMLNINQPLSYMHFNGGTFE